MAKKKGARPTASRGAKKKSAPRGARRKTATKRPRAGSAPKRILTGLENPKEVDLTPLKAQLRAHVERLERVKEPRSLQIQQTLEILQRARAELSSPCGLSMVIATE